VSNLTVIRNAMSAQIGRLAAPALRSMPELNDQVNPPYGAVVPARNYVSYAVTLQGATGFGPVLGAAATTPLSPSNFFLDYLIVLSKSSTLERVEAAMDAWLGFEGDSGGVSVAAAVAADPTLGGTVSWCLATTADSPGPLSYNGVEMFGCRIHFTLSQL
jgi:hypothetical protein